MIIDEAIRELEFAKLTDDYMLHEAADMAIKALRQEDILDKIKAEIKQYNRQAPHYDMISVGLIFQIIDKYKVESEV